MAAVTGLVIVAGAFYLCTRIVGTLMNRRSELAKFIPHPVAFTRTTTSAPKTSDTTTVLTPTPLPQDTSPDLVADIQQEPGEGVKDSAAVVDMDANGSLVDANQVEDQEAGDEGGKLFEGSEDLGFTVDSFDPLPVELTEGNLRERAQVAIRAASNATGAAQR